MDILITSTAAPGFVVTQAQLAAVMRGRRDRPLFVIDIAVPRDVEPAANDVEGVYLYDIDSLQEIARQAMDARQQEIDACERIIRGHVDEFAAWAAVAARAVGVAAGCRRAGGTPRRRAVGGDAGGVLDAMRASGRRDDAAQP